MDFVADFVAVVVVSSLLSSTSIQIGVVVAAASYSYVSQHDTDGSGRATFEHLDIPGILSISWDMGHRCVFGGPGWTDRFGYVQGGVWFLWTSYVGNCHCLYSSKLRRLY